MIGYRIIMAVPRLKTVVVVGQTPTLLRMLLSHFAGPTYYCTLNREFTSATDVPQGSCDKWWDRYLSASDPVTKKLIQEDVEVHEDFLSVEEHDSLFNEIEPYMKRLRYEYDHWDNAIHGYRETERKHWLEANKNILNRLKSVAFKSTETPLPFIHVLDINKDGYIKAHVDSVRFCGRTIAGLSLLSPGVMRLACEKDTTKYADLLLLPRSLYILRDRARFDFTHELFPDEKSTFRGEHVQRDRRISIMSRLEVIEED